MNSSYGVPTDETGRMSCRDDGVEPGAIPGSPLKSGLDMLPPGECGID